MAEKLIYTADDVQKILKKAIEATSIGIFEFINKEHIILDELNKIEICSVILKTNYSSQKNINQELEKVGIIYNIQA